MPLRIFQGAGGFSYLLRPPLPPPMKRESPLIFFVLFIFLAIHAFGQAPAIEWHRCLGGGSGDYGQAVEPTADGGYIVAGYTMSNDGDVTFNHHYDQPDLWVVKLDSSGVIQWKKSFGGSGWDFAYSVHQTADGGYILFGNTASSDGDITYPHGGMDCWLLKLDAAGNLQWQRNYGGSKNEYGWSAQICADGGYILAGLTESTNGDVTTNHGDRDFWILKVDVNGLIQWQKSFGGSKDDEALSVATCSDGGYIVSGFTESNDGDVSGNNGTRDFWIIKLTSFGTLQWQKCLGGTNFEEAWSIKQCTDGGFIAAGYTWSNDGDVSGNHYTFPGASDFWVVKLDASGYLQWQKCYGSDRGEQAFDIQLTSDGGYIVGGYAQGPGGDVRCNQGHEDCWMIKINSTGTLQWQKNMGGNGVDQIYALRQANDGGYIITGLVSSANVSGYHPTTSPTGQGGDMWVIKLSPDVAGNPKPKVFIDPAVPVACAGITLTLTANTNYAGTNPSYQWKKNGIVVGGNGSAYSASDFVENDVIICTVVTAADCNVASDFASDTVVIRPVSGTQPTISIIANTTSICAGTPVSFVATLSNQNPGAVYQWKENGVVVGTNSASYTNNKLRNGDVINCSYTDNSFCSQAPPAVSNSITMRVSPMFTPAVSITGPQNAICRGSVATFASTVQDGGNSPTLQWMVNGQPVGTNQSTFTYSTPAEGDIVNCKLTIDPTLKCATTQTNISNSITLQVGASLAPTISIKSSDNNFCADKSVTFTATPINPGLGPTYQWKLNNQTVGDNSTKYLSGHLKNGDEVYCILMPTNNNCFSGPVNSDTVHMNIFPVPVINISPKDTIIKPGSQITLNARVSGNISSIQWSPSNELVNANVLSPLTISMTVNTIFKLEVTSADGCVASATASVKITQPLVMPNAFSPDGNQVNDIFRIPLGAPIQLQEFSIFDRWGAKVFTTKNATAGWNGTIKGKPADTGVYVYIIKGKDQNGNVLIKGSVVLVR